VNSQEKGDVKKARKAGACRDEFTRTRHADILEDDIYTLQNVDIYEGREVPASETEFFLPP